MPIIINEPTFKNGTLRIEAHSETEPEKVFYYIETQGVDEIYKKEVFKKDLEILSRQIANGFIEKLKW